MVAEAKQGLLPMGFSEGFCMLPRCACRLPSQVRQTARRTVREFIKKLY